MQNKQKLNIVAIGDSITYGYPYSPEYSWLSLAAKELNINTINAGINGDTTGGMLGRFTRDVLQHNPSHVVIMGGTNDAYAGINAEEVLENIHGMITLAAKHGILPIIGLPIPINDVAEEQLVSTYRKKMHCLAVANNIQIIDFHKAMLAEDRVKIRENLHCDGLHPNTAGYEVMALVFNEALIRLIIDVRVHYYYWEHDFSCAITTITIMSELCRTELNSQVFSAAYGLNAGRLRTQCGLVEGALLFIGIYAKQKGMTPELIAGVCRKYSEAFQAEFGSVLCSDLRPNGFSPNDQPHLCEKLTKQAICFTAEFVQKI